ncbi:hypothetical protein [Methylobacterium sp. D54C]|jgi:hypothetical protein
MTKTMWVYRENGTLQCHPEIRGISLEELKGQLGKIAGAENILSQEERTLPVMIPAVCGAMTGRVNAYELNEMGTYMLFHGFVGPMGFKPWIWSNPNQSMAFASGEDPFAYNRLLHTDDHDKMGNAFLNIISTATSAGTQPTTIAELSGRLSRYYKQGDMITLDYRPERVNTEVNDSHTIQRIWFG